MGYDPSQSTERCSSHHFVRLTFIPALIPRLFSRNFRPFNYPYILSFNPMVGAIAAGCPVVLKPSEANPNASALIAELVPKYLDPNAYAVVNGGPEETTALLDFRWDHIFFTGGTRVGQIVATAAAKHITPVTLELGGKSPVIIDSDCDIDLAAKRVLFGKSQNMGQVRDGFRCAPLHIKLTLLL